MKLKQLFCSHRKLTAIDMYYKKQKHSPYFTAVGYRDPIVILQCDKCKKLLRMLLCDMQWSRHEFRFDVDVNNLGKYKVFGGKEEIKELEEKENGFVGNKKHKI